MSTSKGARKHKFPNDTYHDTGKKAIFGDGSELEIYFSEGEGHFVLYGEEILTITENGVIMNNLEVSDGVVVDGDDLEDVITGEEIDPLSVHLNQTTPQTMVGQFNFPEVRAGSVSHNTDWDSTGHQTMVGSAKPWEDLRIEPSVRQAAGTGVPSFEKWYDDLAGTSRGVFLYSFTKENTANQKEVFFTVQMPHAWDGGVLSMHIHWVPAATENATDVIWGMEYCMKDIGEVYGDTTIVYTSATLIPDDANITAGKHYISEFADITPGADANGISMVLIGRIFRRSGDASDTYTNKVGLMYIDLHYQLNSLGSTDEYLK